MSLAYLLSGPSGRPGLDWIHEVKHDGYRLMVRREASRVRTWPRLDTGFAEVADAIASLRRINSLTIDGECCVCGADGVPDFAKLHSGSYDSAVVLYAFDLLELNGREWRVQPLEKRKAKLGVGTSVVQRVGAACRADAIKDECVDGKLIDPE